uniref:Hydroxyproline O-arabinosyltransferase-like domain-containing protein n=1 Tax=Chlamydomonas leiostraca TaxID=1034604 RepID=A0A7S0X0W7_9CHLO|mmetsp:Transcript_4320/g.10743  ORF Transcript_4320/g.10743 Transcript_4320/m.10743 type:complete len:673 (+) Transcript_4320:93-2111(+)
MSGRGLGHAAPRRSGSSQFKLVVIALFSCGLLGGYLFFGSPNTGAMHRRGLGNDLHFGGHHDMGASSIKTGGQSAILGNAGVGSSSTAGAKAGGVLSRFATRYTGKVAPVASPPPHVAVTENDQRHPHNVVNMMAGQSGQDEIKADQVSQLLAQQSDTSEAAAAKKASAAATTDTGKGSLKKGSSSMVSGKGSKASKASSTTGTGHAASADTSAVIDASTGSKAKGGKGSATGGDAAGVHSSVASTTAALKKASDQLKAANAVLEKAGVAAADDAAATTTSTTSTAKKSSTSTRAAGARKGGNAAGIIQFKPNAEGRIESFNTQDAPGCAGAGKDCGLPGDTIHTLFTSNGSPYQNFQARVMVATWHLVRQQPGGEKLVAMTRVLHRTTPDELMDEVDTFRADPLQPECDKWCWFPVADRANAMQQWIDAVAKTPSLQKAPWVLLLETDYVWVKPLQAPGDAYNPKVPGLSFAFDYIGPSNHVVGQILKDYCPTCEQSTVPNSGPAPVLARYEDFKAATPLWEELSKWIETHEDAKKVLGWVREMYAWDIAVALHPDIKMLTEEPYISRLIVQPPHEDHLGAASMCHYTWGAIYNDTKGEVWRWEKRDYTSPENALKVPHLKMPPHPYQPNTWHLQAHEPVTQRLHETLEAMIAQMNRAIDKLPDLTNKAKP